MEGGPRMAVWEGNESGIRSRVHKEPVLGSLKSSTGQLGCSSEPGHLEPVCLRSWVPIQLLPKQQTDMVAYTCNLSIQGGRQEDPEFKATLSYVASWKLA